MFKRLLLSYYLCALCFFDVVHTNNISSAVTYEFEKGGRLGDHLMTYSKAKWIAYKYNLPFYYTPFEFSQHLAMHTKEPRLTPEIKKKFTRVIHFRKHATENIAQENATLYIIHRRFIDSEAWSYSYGDMADTLRSHKPFLNELKAMITPTRKIKKPKIPLNTISLAVHVRRGGGFDLPLRQQSLSLPQQTNNPNEKFADQIWPAKFPPYDFYIEQVKLIAKQLGKSPFYLHIFTDDPNPNDIVNIFKKSLAELPIIFDCRSKGNSHNCNILEDLFAMKNFDFLIRPESSLSLFAQILGNHQLTIYPLHATWQNDATLIVDKVGYSGPLATKFTNQLKQR